MTTSGHLWAIGYDDMTQAATVRDKLVSLGWGKHYLILEDIAVVVRHSDGSFTLDREAFPTVSNVAGCTLIVFSPGSCWRALAGAAVGAIVGGAGVAVSATVGIETISFATWSV